MENLVKSIEQENLKEDRQNLRKLNTKRLKFEEGIIMDENKRLDELHIKFIEDKNDLTMDQIILVKEVFDFLKR